jgi:hypothetical protein
VISARCGWPDNPAVMSSVSRRWLRSAAAVGPLPPGSAHRRHRVPQGEPRSPRWRTSPPPARVPRQDSEHSSGANTGSEAYSRAACLGRTGAREDGWRRDLRGYAGFAGAIS